MMKQNPCFLVALLLLAIATVSGCGANSASKGPSLPEEIEKARSMRDPRTRAIALIRVSAKQRNAGDMPGAQASINAATGACDEIEDPATRADALASVAEALAKTNYKGEAESLLKKVRQAADQTDDHRRKVTIVARMAEIYGYYLENQDRATANLASIEPTAKAVVDPEVRIMVMTDVAYAYWRIHAPDDAARVLDEALDTARNIQNVHQKVNSLGVIAAQLSRMNKSDDAQHWFAEAEQLAGQIAPSHSQAHALIDLAKHRHDSGQKTEAQRLLSKAQSVAETVDDQSLKGPLLTRIGDARNRL